MIDAFTLRVCHPGSAFNQLFQLNKVRGNSFNKIINAKFMFQNYYIGIDYLKYLKVFYDFDKKILVNFIIIIFKIFK